MSLKIRLSRGGAKKRPFYRVVVANSRSPRDGRFIERLGTFDPLKAKDAADRLVLDAEKAKEWIGKGATPTDRVARLLESVGVGKREKRNNPEKALPKKKAQERAAAAGRRRSRRRVSDNAPPASKPGRELVLLGRFGAPHGVRGEIRLQSFTADPLAIASYGPLFDKSGARSFVLAHVRPQGKDMLVARVEGVTDSAGAEKLTRIELYAPRAKLPEPDEDEFYLADLEGLRAETVEGATLGHVLAVRNFGAGDILEVRPPQGGETLMFPFTKAVVPIVDIAGGRVVIAPPEEIEGEG